MTPLSMFHACTVAISLLTETGLKIDGVQTTTSGMRAEGSTSEGERLVVQVSFSSAPGGTVATVQRQIERRLRTRRGMGADYTAAVRAALA